MGGPVQYVTRVHLRLRANNSDCTLLYWSKQLSIGHSIAHFKLELQLLVLQTDTCVDTCTVANRDMANKCIHLRICPRSSLKTILPILMEHFLSSPRWCMHCR